MSTIYINYGNCKPIDDDVCGCLVSNRGGRSGVSEPLCWVENSGLQWENNNISKMDAESRREYVS